MTYAEFAKQYLTEGQCARFMKELKYGDREVPLSDTKSGVINESKVWSHGEAARAYWLVVFNGFRNSDKDYIVPGYFAKIKPPENTSHVDGSKGSFFKSKREVKRFIQNARLHNKLARFIITRYLP
jgi:hypothetical protein